jgi:hypothetical protein
MTAISHIYIVSLLLTQFSKVALWVAGKFVPIDDFIIPSGSFHFFSVSFISSPSRNHGSQNY